MAKFEAGQAVRNKYTGKVLVVVEVMGHIFRPVAEGVRWCFCNDYEDAEAVQLGLFEGVKDGNK